MSRSLVKLKEIDDVTCNSKVLRHNRHFDVVTTEEDESRHCFFVFGWIKLKCGVRGNFWLLISNLNSKMQYLFAISRKFYFSSLDHGNNEWSIFHLLISKTSMYTCLKVTEVL